MDLGFFESSRLRFWLWLCIPALVAVAVTAATMVWLHQERKNLAERQALLADLPLIEVQVRKTEALLKSVSPVASQMAQATDGVSRRLDQAAQRAGLTVRSVKFGENGTSAEGLATLQISVQIQGPFRAVVQWLDEIQKPGILVSVKQAELLALSLPPDDTFTGDVVLMVYLRSL
jgi:hypothetical protein